MEIVNKAYEFQEVKGVVHGSCANGGDKPSTPTENLLIFAVKAY